MRHKKRPKLLWHRTAAVRLSYC